MTHGHVGHDISVRPCCHTPRGIIGFFAGTASAIVGSMTNTTLLRAFIRGYHTNNWLRLRSLPRWT